VNPPAAAPRSRAVRPRTSIGKTSSAARSFNSPQRLAVVFRAIRPRLRSELRLRGQRALDSATKRLRRGAGDANGLSDPRCSSFRRACRGRRRRRAAGAALTQASGAIRDLALREGCHAMNSTPGRRGAKAPRSAGSSDFGVLCGSWSSFLNGWSRTSPARRGVARHGPGRGVTWARRYDPAFVAPSAVATRRGSRQRLVRSQPL
jgi:hypothetical protein